MHALNWRGYIYMEGLIREVLSDLRLCEAGFLENALGKPIVRHVQSIPSSFSEANTYIIPLHGMANLKTEEL